MQKPWLMAITACRQSTWLHCCCTYVWCADLTTRFWYPHSITVTWLALLSRVCLKCVWWSRIGSLGWNFSELVLTDKVTSTLTGNCSGLGLLRQTPQLSLSKLSLLIRIFISSQFSPTLIAWEKGVCVGSSGLSCFEFTFWYPTWIWDPIRYHKPCLCGDANYCADSCVNSCWQVVILVLLCMCVLLAQAWVYPCVDVIRGCFLARVAAAGLWIGVASVCNPWHSLWTSLMVLDSPDKDVTRCLQSNSNGRFASISMKHWRDSFWVSCC